MTTYHADVVSIEQDLRELGLSARVVAIGQVSVSSLQAQHVVKSILFRHILKHHVCGKLLAHIIFSFISGIYILTKSSNPRRVPLNSVLQLDMTKSTLNLTCSPLSPFIMTQIGEPTHRSISSRGSSWDAICAYAGLAKEVHGVVR